MISKIKLFTIIISIFFLTNLLPFINAANFSATLTTSRTIMDIGQIAYLNITVNPPSNNYSYIFYINGIAIQSTSPSLVFNPEVYESTHTNRTTIYNIYANVTSTSGVVKTNSVTITVYPELIVSSITPNEVTTDSGLNFSFSANAMGGAGNYIFNWIIALGKQILYKTPLPASNNNKSKFIFNMPISGNFTVWVSVTDLAGMVVNSSNAILNVNPRPKVLLAPIGNILINPSNYTFYGYVDGGTPPYNITWYVNGIPVKTTVNNNHIFKLTHNFNTPGSYTVSYSLKDSANLNDNMPPFGASNIETNVTVTAASIPTIKYLSYYNGVLDMNFNMTIKLSAYSEIFNNPIMWVLDDNIVLNNSNNFTFTPIRGITAIGPHPIYAMILYNNIYIPGGVWTIDVNNYPFFVKISSPKNIFDSQKYIFLNIKSFLETYPVQAIAYINTKSGPLNISFNINSYNTNVTLPLPINYLGNGKIYVVSSLNKSYTNVLYVNSNYFNISIVSGMSNPYILFNVNSIKNNMVSASFKLLVSGGTPPYNAQWIFKHNNTKIPMYGLSGTINLMMQNYHVTLNISDYYGMQIEKNFILNLTPPHIFVVNLNNYPKYNSSVYYVSNTNLTLNLTLSTTFLNDIKQINYTLYIFVNNTPEELYSSFKYFKNFVLYISNYSMYYNYLIPINLSNYVTNNPNSSYDFLIYLSAYSNSNFSVNQTILINYSNSNPILGNIISQTSTSNGTVYLNFKNVQSLVPIYEYKINTTFGMNLIIPGNSTYLNITLPEKNGYFIFNITAITYSLKKSSKSFTIFYDINGIQFTANITNLENNYVTIIIKYLQNGNVYPSMIRISNNPYFIGSNWIPFTSILKYRINNYNGTIYIQIQDSDGVITENYIMYNYSPPSSLKYIYAAIASFLVAIILVFLFFLMPRYFGKNIMDLLKARKKPIKEWQTKESKEEIFLRELTNLGEPRLTYFKKYLKETHNITDEEFEELIRDLSSKGVIELKLDEEKRTRITLSKNKK